MSSNQRIEFPELVNKILENVNKINQMSKINKISVLIPCYNEENTISQVIIKVEKSLLGR